VRNSALWFPCSRCHLACNSHSSDHLPQTHWGPLPQSLRFRVVGGGRRGRGGAAQNLTVFHHLAQRKDGQCGFKCYICLGIQVSTTLPTAWRRATREIPPDCPCPGAKCLMSCMFFALLCPAYAVCTPFGAVFHACKAAVLCNPDQTQNSTLLTGILSLSPANSPARSRCRSTLTPNTPRRRWTPRGSR